MSQFSQHYLWSYLWQYERKVAIPLCVRNWHSSLIQSWECKLQYVHTSITVHSLSTMSVSPHYNWGFLEIYGNTILNPCSWGKLTRVNTIITGYLEHLGGTGPKCLQNLEFEIYMYWQQRFNAHPLHCHCPSLLSVCTVCVCVCAVSYTHLTLPTMAVV